MFGDVAGRGEDEPHGMLGHGRVAVALDGGDLDAEPLRCSKVDEAAGAGAQEHDMLEAGAARERRLGEVGRVVDAGVVALEEPGNIALGHRPHVDGDGHVAGAVHPLPEPIDIRRGVDEKCFRHLAF